MKKGIALALLLALLLPLCACAAPKTVRVGLLEPLSGENAASGVLEAEGVRAAWKALGAAGQWEVELVVRDAAQENAARELIEAGCVAVIGSAQAAGELAERKIPLLSPSALSGKGENFFLLAPSDSDRQRALARFAKEQGWERIAVVVEPESAVCVSLRDEFLAAAGEAAVAEIRLGADREGAANDLKAAAPDAVCLAASPERAGDLIQLLSPDLPLLCPDFWEDSLSELREGIYCAGVADGQSERLGAALRAVGVEEQTALAALGYEAYAALHAALSATASPSPEALTAALQTVQTEGILGPIAFQNGRRAPGCAVILTRSGDALSPAARYTDL